jgi:hypothetical protein
MGEADAGTSDHLDGRRVSGPADPSLHIAVTETVTWARQDNVVFAGRRWRGRKSRFEHHLRKSEEKVALGEGPKGVPHCQVLTTG